MGDYYDASASVTVKFINVKSGRVLHIINNSITISESNREQAKQQALKYCFGHAFVVKLREKFSLHSRIKEIDGNIVYFFNGKQLGVKEGSRYKILAEEAGSEKLDLKGDNKLRKKIGVIEVIKVAEGISKGKIIWNSEEVETGDLIKEMISITNNQVKLEVSRRSVSLIERRNDGDTINKGALLYKLHYGWETPYQMESSFYGGLSLIKELNMFDLGFQVGKEFPLKYGKTYLSLKGNGGLAMARQRTGFILLNFLDADTAKFPYLGGSAGLKIYTNHKDVLRLEAGLNYQLGPSFSWNYGKYKTANCSGLGFYGAATIPFGQGAGKEKAMKFKDIDENLKKANQVLKTIEDIMDAF